MRINHNIFAISANRNLSITNNSLTKTLEKLSSGLKVNQAADDAAGLAISEKMRAQIHGLQQTSRNIQDAVSLVQTAEGGLNEIHSLLQRGRELAVQAANGTLSEENRGHIQKETKQILEEINNIATHTAFNGKKLLSNGSGFIAVPPSGGTGTVTGPIAPSTPDTVADSDEQAIIEAIKTSMLSESEQLIQQYFGINADGADIGIYVDDNMASSTLAFVSYYVGADGKGFNVELHLNKSSFLDPSPSIGNDRVIAHEMTHAIMARSMNYGVLPKWFKEGAAEFIHGADERLYADLYYNGTSNVVNAIGEGTDAYWTNNSLHYSSGYAAVRYLHEQIKDAGGSGIKDIMVYLSNHQSASLDDALKNISSGSYSNGLTGFMDDFQANGAAFINTLNLSNADTGAIGGLDADGGEIRDAESVIPDTGIYSDDPLTHFNEIWPMSESSTGGSTASPYIHYYEKVIYNLNSVQSSEEPLTMQIGPSQGQSFQINRSNVTTESLGINGINMVTSASDSITLFDHAITLVSSERSRYGAIQNRLEHSMKITDMMAENLVATESKIRDANIANEMLHFTKSNIIAQAAQSMLSQSNQITQGVLQLLR
ncbi:flagellinolysin [Ornithinibacillus xuwenensis]|uniref:Flagellin n=1 Tax=Ornithinibacillus xuwenensis TaxID=3144668 RepID=A0ABU9XK78_9BACI